MIKNNPIQFAVVREDSRIEEQLIEKYDIERVLMIASGGCTALNLLTHYPNISLTLLDPNASQLNLIKQKIALLNSEQTALQKLTQFNVRSHVKSKVSSHLESCSDGTLDNNLDSMSDSNGLNQCGNFESLFRHLRRFIYEMVADSSDWLAFFQGNASVDFLQQVFVHPYWSVAFELFFSDTHLITMFGPDAVQHAMPQSYPQYFQALLERGLLERELNVSSADNYFLHHIFLGYYLPHALPPYLASIASESVSVSAGSKSRKSELISKSIQSNDSQLIDSNRIDYVNGFLHDVPSLAPYQMINLSNILDWMSLDNAKAILERIKQDMPVGSIVLWRQLNNNSNYKRYLEPVFEFDDDMANQALQADRSLFYSTMCIGKKVCE